MPYFGPLPPLPLSLSFFEREGRVNFEYLEGEFWKIKKGGGSIAQEQVFLKGGGRLTLFLFNYFKVYHFYI